MKTKISIWIFFNCSKSFFNCFPYQNGKTIFLQMRTFPFIFIRLHIFYSSSHFIHYSSTPMQGFSVWFPLFPPWFPAFLSQHFQIPTLIPRILIIPTLIPRIPTLIPRITIITTMISGIPTMFHRIPIIPPIPFLESPFWLLQIAFRGCSRNRAGNCSFYRTF